MQLVVIAHNIRSTHNIGAILRTADGFGAHKVYLSGYSPYPTQADDSRPPHIRAKLSAQIHKTALGAETTVDTAHAADVTALLRHLKAQGYQLIALEQSPWSQNLADFTPNVRCALLLGEEVHGIPDELLKLCDAVVEIPMRGHKESFNVSVAAGIALYQLTLKRPTPPQHLRMIK